MWFLGQAEDIDLGTLLQAACGEDTARENIAVSQLTEDNMGRPTFCCCCYYCCCLLINVLVPTTSICLLMLFVCLLMLFVCLLMFVC